MAGALLVSLPAAGWAAPAPATAALSASAATSASQAVAVTKARTAFLGQRTLRRGDRGRDVKRLQKLLLVINTGYFGPLTSKAVRRVERRYGLKVDTVVDRSTLSAIRKHAKARAQRQARTSRAVSRGVSRGGSPAVAKRFARTYIADTYGWGDRQMSCLVSMWERESNWNYRASNPNGRYHGIPQTSSAVWQAHGFSRAQYMGSAAVQIRVGARYIKGRYGSPCAAWAFWKSHHWY